MTNSTRLARTAFALSALIASVVWVCPVTAQSEEAGEDARVEKLEREVEILKQQIKILRATISQLRAKVDRMSGSSSSVGGKPAITGSGESGRVNPLLPPAPRSADEVLGRTSSPNTTNDSTGTAVAGATKTRTYTSVRSLLAAMPPEAQPDADRGWDASRVAKARLWLLEKAPGRQLSTSLTMFDKTVGPAPRPEGQIDDTPRYRIGFTFRPTRYTDGDMTYEARILDRNGQPLSITVNQIIARNASQAFRPGRVLPVTGKIKSVRILRATSTQTEVELTLDSYTVANFKP